MRASMLLLVLVVMQLAGCGGSSAPSPSTSFATSSIYAFVRSVQDESGSVTTTVQLRDGAASTAGYIYLAGGETLYASLDAPPAHFMSFSNDLFGNSVTTSQRLKVMQSRNLYIDHLLFETFAVGNPEYVASDTPASAATPVRAYVDLERTGKVMAGASSIELPPAFQITAPASAAIVSRASPPTLTWSPVDPASTMMLEVAYVCDDGTQGSPDAFNLGLDTGSAVLSASHLPTPTTTPSSNCQTAFKLQRVRTGSISANFALGNIKGIQQRAVKFTTTP